MSQVHGETILLPSRVPLPGRVPWEGWEAFIRDTRSMMFKKRKQTAGWEQHAVVCRADSVPSKGHTCLLMSCSCSVHGRV